MHVIQYFPRRMEQNYRNRRILESKTFKDAQVKDVYEKDPQRWCYEDRPGALPTR